MARTTRLVAAALTALLAAACTPDVQVVEIEAIPSEVETTEDEPTEDASTEPEPTPTETEPTESESPTEEGPRPATDTDRARFVAAYEPASATSLEHVATDLDGDDQEELVFTYVRGSQLAQLDVAWWDGEEYRIRFSDAGGPGTTIDRVGTSDINGDGLTDLLTRQSGDDGAESVTLWTVVGPEQIVPLAAEGGCRDRSNTYGDTGVELVDRDADGIDEVYATCEDGTVDRYRWSAGAYRHDPGLEDS